MTDLKKNRQAESGNVLFLILIAVALFAALSYVVTQSTRSGGGSTEREKNILSSAQMTQYPTALRTSIIRLVLGGVGIESVRFDAPATSGQFVTSANIEVFHPNGGGATYQQASADLSASGTSPLDWIYNANFEVPGIGTTGSGGNEVIAFLPGVSNGVCKQVNEELNVNLGNCTGMQGGVPTFSAGAGLNTGPNNNLTGSAPFPTSDQTDIVGTGCTVGFSGQASGCFYDSSATPPRFVFYSVLLER